MVVYSIDNPTPSLANGAHLPSKRQKIPNSLFLPGFLAMWTRVTWPSLMLNRIWVKVCWVLLGKSFSSLRRVTGQETALPLLWPDAFVPTQDGWVDILELWVVKVTKKSPYTEDGRVERWKGFLGDTADLQNQHCNQAPSLQTSCNVDNKHSS